MRAVRKAVFVAHFVVVAATADDSQQSHGGTTTRKAVLSALGECSLAWLMFAAPFNMGGFFHKGYRPVKHSAQNIFRLVKDYPLDKR
jgi:hypothetical protein